MVNKKIYTSIATFDDIPIEEAVKTIETLSKNEDGFSYVVTPNIDHLERLTKSTASSPFYQAYNNAALTLCDSRILSKLLLLAKKPIKSVIPGSDLTAYLFNHSLTETDRIIVFGCEEKEITALYQQYPSLNIRHINPSMGFIHKKDEVAELIEQIKAIKAHYIFLAVGSPRQEIFARQLKLAGLGKGVALCIGASINFIVGVESRAPNWLQVIHMEWLYRMLQDPLRLVQRYSSNALYLPKIFIDLLKNPH